MTYWYPGVREAVARAKEVHPGAPVILGGIYARLCTEHALRTAGADFVISSGGLDNMGAIIDTLREQGIEGCHPLPKPYSLPYPAFDLLNKIDYISIMTSVGCPYQCAYCASRQLYPAFSKRDPQDVLEEIIYWHKSFGVRDFAFYDDALLFRSETHISPILKELISLDMDLRFHTPNALHIREITSDLARQLYVSGFRTIRLGLETSDMSLRRDLDRKVSEGEFERAVKNLKSAGFKGRDIGVYILMGLPGQSVKSVKQTVEYVGKTGSNPFLAEYSPLPNTPLWKKAVNCSEYDLLSDPLFHNNTLLPCWNEQQKGQVPELKNLVGKIRRKLIFVSPALFRSTKNVLPAVL
jgi:radical SAM superfamily enzyme YgiQ (UPF0313 family)